MNYRHAYHAGNPADVLKHAVLTATVERLLKKPSPLFLLDTHAGIGIYDLAAPEPGKTREWDAGIGRLFAAPQAEGDPGLAPFLAVVRACNPGGTLRYYPGSPAIMEALKRPNDRLLLCELHPEDAEMLRAWAAGRSAVAVHTRDGYEALKAFLPPAEGRGLIVVDPPYEDPGEFDRLAEAILAGRRRWPAGRWLIWYPIKDRAPVWRLEEALIAGGLTDLLTVELLMRPEDGMHLAGSGVLLVNPPYMIEDRLSAILAELQALLALEHGSHAVQWLGRR